jgi:hypothetical protein
MPQHQRRAMHYNKPDQLGQVSLANQYRMNAHIDRSLFGPLEVALKLLPFPV